MRAALRQRELVTLRQPRRSMPVCRLACVRSGCTLLRFSSRKLSAASLRPLGGSLRLASSSGPAQTPGGPDLLQVASTLRSAESRGGSGSEEKYRDPGASGMSSSELSDRMVWVDLEMTGLDIEKDQIIEMACVITDAQLNVVAEGPNLVIKQPDHLLEGMSDWCKEHHGQSGLVQAVRDSHMTLDQAEYEFLSFVRQHTPPGQCPLAGNSVHADKKFLDKHMPQFMFHLHYRIIDVSTIKELSRRWFPQEYKMVPHKKASHRALDDIRESIKELQYYRAVVFKAAALH